VRNPTIDEDKDNARYRLERQIYPEAKASGFAHLDQEIAFFTQVAALLDPDDILLDFGAGRGEFMENDPVRYRRSLENFRGRCAHVDGCDVDPIVRENPTLDAAQVITIGDPLPYEDNRFDIIVARYVFEHIQSPEWAAKELLRVLKPGAWLCAMTPNRWGYVAIGSRLIPNRLHARALSRIQPTRLEKDVFPTAYKLNRPSAVRRFFGHSADVYHYSCSNVPSYHFGSKVVFRLLQLVHKLTPPMFANGLYLFIRKRDG
jgi:SAM-dependent methyltransferase